MSAALFFEADNFLARIYAYEQKEKVLKKSLFKLNIEW